MRILLVASATPSSKTGVTAHYNRLLAHLAGRVDSVQLVTPEDVPSLLKKGLGVLRRLAPLFGVNGRVIWMEIENYVSIWASVRRYRGAIDVVHAQDVTSGAAAALGLNKQVPVTVTCHFNDDPLSEYKTVYSLNDWTNRQLLKWYQFLFKQPNSFITVSDYIKRTSAFLRPEGVVCDVIHNGVPFPSEQPRQEDDAFSVLNIGTIEARKNQRLLIETAHVLCQRGITDVKVLFVGDGHQRAELETLTLEKGLQGQVRFEGYQTNIPAYLQRASLYVHTAVNESWGYSITEAIAAGTPVLALETGGIPEQFDWQRAGLLPLTTTASELADAILRYRGETERRSLAHTQLMFARDRFSIDNMIDKHLYVYRRLCRRIVSEDAHNPAVAVS
ncbi:glycosyltransferase family 4 protein [Spirosoma utsteinense]|uniref:Glycosyltransferase involved in cell wall biosynthesis n=1 Tax=Spirosoma utsteinense TaxID=2585773 RepID=A0ABR6W7X0_9BACT|nr:glycosyltransferase family 4 protein [Spirosoma utsteinense]MBC3787715.1 glycosyltransferase involved in cell wall biosynthesis [Spirosoma utsteinense]MBC3792681.1 glycosyltransferase involved in cell wall biosynthesis [Spirosoma utsteinense]